jgi:hypothetical protein
LILKEGRKKRRDGGRRGEEREKKNITVFCPQPLSDRKVRWGKTQPGMDGCTVSRRSTHFRDI